MPSATRPATSDEAPGGRAGTLLGAVRIAVGAIFLWAFLDKLLGLGYATSSAGAWIRGGSPTRGYLTSSYGPLGTVYQQLAGHPVVDFLFMLGLAGVGVALVLGIGMRIAAWAGAAMLLLMWSSHPPWVREAGGQATRSTNPLIDDHIVQALLLLALATLHAGRRLGLGAWWERQPIVRRWPWLA